MQSIRLKWLQTQLGEIAYQLTQVQVAQFYAAQAWTPAINAYLCRGRILICVDLAGVEKEGLDLQVTSRRLRISGRREPPEPGHSNEKALQVLAMEIDYGPFARELELPADVDPDRVTAQQRNGLLWVELPLRLPA